MVDDTHVRTVADRLGLDLTEEERAQYAEAARGMDAQYDSLPAETPTATAATDVEAGTDGHNAVRYRFDLPETDGPLADLELGVKDNLAVAGVPMHCGSAALEFTPEYHATVVDRLHEAGGDVTATTNMDEFAYFTTGETCAFDPIENPGAEGVVPGGSSSGSGAAVAAGLLDAALGSDTGGSVRIPASFCGVVGLKPTHRLVPRFGFADLAPSLDCVGPLAADVETAARVHDTIAGPHPRDPSSMGGPAPPAAADGLEESVDGLSVGVIEPAMAGSDEAVASAVEDAVDALGGQGVSAESVSLPQFETATLAGLVVAGAEFAALALADGQLVGTGTGHSEPWRTAVREAVRSPDLGANVREQILTNGALAEDGLDHYVAAQTLGAEFTAVVDEALGSYDALVAPTTPMTAPEFGEITSDEDFARTVANTVPFNLTGHPALSVPIETADGEPVGLEFVGARRDEATLVALGAALETAAGS
ncbi:amidase [Halorubrum sp. Atlit-28R]|uniref:amidase n=1 Tax=Halorubrum sp. Atlit-28R TaxID=2282129 RepID=UPI001314EEC3|nr:amidase family protein [Halorubrum sp. Atlit-28R]